MPEPEIDNDSTNEILKELRTFTKEIRDLLLHKAIQENRTTQQTNEASHQGKDSPGVSDAAAHQPFNTETANVGIVIYDDWPSHEAIARYRSRCAKHKSECEKMQVELGYFIAHLGIVGGNQRVIETAESLRKGLLDPVHCLEKTFDAAPCGRWNAVDNVKDSFGRLNDFVRGFARSPHQDDAVYPDKVEQWWNSTRNGWDEIGAVGRYIKFVGCLEFIHDVFFSELETAMGGVIEALITFEEKSASEWLATQRIGDFDKHIRSILPTTESDDRTSAWASPVEIAQFKEKSMNHKLSCNEMQEELGHLIAHYGVVGGDKEVVKEAKVLQSSILAPIDCLECALTLSPNERQEAMVNVVVSFRNVHIHVNNFQKSLYHQKHAFYFRKFKKWMSFLWNGILNIMRLLRDRKVVECLRYICNDLFSKLEEAMIGVSKASEKASLPGQKEDTGSVVGELETFGRESLPKFLVDQMERDTTRYVNLTTIATFFSSVTATTLQFTYAPLQTEESDSLRGVVNLFWFLSLVFSVSSGVNSLLGLTWRKSSIYDSRVPPKLIRMWFDKAPMLFLIIAAIAFVVGLNLFAYLSLQPRYVTFATTILTGLHGACLLALTTWFIYQLKHESIWAKWIGNFLQWIEDFRVWKWFKDLLISTWEWVQHPRQKYREKKLHLQRNFFWALGIDNRVVLLNYIINWNRDWPEPYLLSKLIRCVADLIKRSWLTTKKAISDLSCTVQAHLCMPSPTGRAGGDVEMGESVRREEAEVPVETSSPDEKAKDEFRISLQKVFSNADRVMSIMNYMEYEIKDDKEMNYIEKLLWGYPSLVEKFDEVVCPALAEAREKRWRERVEAGQQDTATENDAIGSLIPEVAGQDTDNTTHVPPQGLTTRDKREHANVTRQVTRVPSSPTATTRTTQDRANAR